MEKTVSILAVYLSNLANEGKSKLTIERYEVNLNKWFKFQNITCDDDLKSVTSMDIERYNSELFAQNLSSNTRYSYVAPIKALYTFLVRHKIVNENPVTTRIRINTVKEAMYLNGDEAIKLLRACKNPRDKAMFTLIFETGLRCSEFSNIKVSDIKVDTYNDVNVYLITVLGKGNKKRTIGISQATYEIINDYLSKRKTNSELLFCTGDGQKIYNAALNRTIKSIARKAGFENWKDFHIHMTRHSFASMQVASGINMKDLQTLMGHNDIQTTTRIYTHVNELELAKRMSVGGLGGKLNGL